MMVLSINTTSRVINIALSSGEKVFGIEKDIQISSYESVISLIKLILKKAKVRIEEVDCFGVCVGPGSFTGIRIGLSTMKALAYSMNRPLIGFRSLDLVANLFSDEFKGLLCIIQDARRENVYATVFSNYRSFRRVTPYLLIRVPELFKKLKGINRKNMNLYFCGDAIPIYKDQIGKIFPNSFILDHQSNNLKKSQAIISITKDNFRQRSNSFKLLPFYMYPKDCQVRRATKK